MSVPSQRSKSEYRPSEVLTTDDEWGTVPTETGNRGPVSCVSEPFKYRNLWKRAFFRLKARRALKNLSTDILIYGTSNEFTDFNGQYRCNIDAMIEKKLLKQSITLHIDDTVYHKEAKYCGLIKPDSDFKKIWSLVLMVFMLYTATLMPYRIAFEDEVFWDFWTCVDMMLDFVFMTDVFLTFFSISEKDDGTFEFRHSKIAIMYLRTWFVVDLVSCFPMTLVDFCTGNGDDSASPSSKYNSLMRLARLPRMYKLIRIIRLVKVMKHFRTSSIFERFQDYLQINARKM